MRNSIVACADAESLTACCENVVLPSHWTLKRPLFYETVPSMPLVIPVILRLSPNWWALHPTAMPASDTPSRQNSESALPCDFKEALTMEGVAKMLGEKVINFHDLDFGELLSRGEHTTVQKAKYRGFCSGGKSFASSSHHVQSGRLIGCLEWIWVRILNVQFI